MRNRKPSGIRLLALLLLVALASAGVGCESTTYVGRQLRLSGMGRTLLLGWRGLGRRVHGWTGLVSPSRESVGSAASPVPTR